MKDSYQLKAIPEDFEVTEVPIMPTTSSKEKSRYTYIWVLKKGYTSFEIQDQLAEYFKLTPDHIGFAGLKDEDGVTRQLVGVQSIITPEQIIKFNQAQTNQNQYIRLETVQGYGKEGIVPKKLHGNTFKITLRNITNSQVKQLQTYLQAHRYISYINYYDNQRFGLPGGPYISHQIGKAITTHNWIQAYKYFKKSGNKAQSMLSSAQETQADQCLQFFQALSFNKVDFFISAYNSYLWNKRASSYIKTSCDAKLISYPHIGDLAVPKQDTFSLANIISVSGFEVSPKLDISHKDKERNLTVTTTVYLQETQKDLQNSGKQAVTISFFNPPGCYATMLVRQLMDSCLL
jgi:tRNA pseudouridine13 synthase